MTAGPAAGISLNSGELAALLGAELRGTADVRLDHIASIEDAGPSSLTFVRDARNAERLSGCRAGAALISRAVADEPAVASRLGGAGDLALLLVEDADLAMIRLLEQITPPRWLPGGVHENAWVDPTATIEDRGALGPNVTVGPGSTIAEGVRLHAGVVIGAGVTIGPGTVIRANCVIEDGTVIGAGVTIHPGVVLGADGFGYRPDPSGAGLIKIPHAGNVVVEDGVEIGANTAIDRGKLGPTRIGAGSKLDNLVQIGHNCDIGRCCIICGCAALAGSVTLGDGVVIGGSAGVADNTTIGAGARVAAGSGVMKDIPPGESWAGHPAQRGSAFFRAFAAANEIADHMNALKRLLRDETRRMEGHDDGGR